MEFLCSVGLAATLASAVSALAGADNSTFINPVLPGWHSDPSCIRVDDTFYCTTSTFIAFPGLPVYASKDLVNWRLISHAWNRDSQLPGTSWNTTIQQDGMWAPTLRFHEGEFWLICTYILNSATLEDTGDGTQGTLFRTKNIYSDEAWSDPLIFYPNKIDPDIFFEDGKAWVAQQGIVLQELDLETGELSHPPLQLWNGTGGVWPEGPHIYKRDGYYYLMIAEGGTASQHAVTIARSRNLAGPYEAHEGNPILTNRYTDAYFQRVGHGDIFDDQNGNWWIIVLASRCGPENLIHPMGRESVMAPVRWEEGQWPVITNVSGRMDVWPLPAESRDVPGNGPFNGDPDEFDFDALSIMPKHFLFHRVPREGTFSFSEGGLEIVPSRSNLTGVAYTDDLALKGQRGISFVARRQTQTVFHFTVDVDARSATEVDQEAGISIFLAQENHADISIVYLSPCSESSAAGLHLRFRAHGKDAPGSATMAIPNDWADTDYIRLHIWTQDTERFYLGASLGDEGIVELGSISSFLVSKLDSAKSGTFIGSLVGVFATCNGAGEGDDCPDGFVAKFQRWRYTPIAQYIEADEYVEV
jgi:beta-xylosidase